MGAVIVFSAMICVILFQIEVVILLFSLTKDIKYNVYQINKKAKSESNRSQFVKQFIELIQLNSSAKQLSLYFLCGNSF